MDKMNGISKLNSVSRVLKLPIRKEEQNIIKTPSVSNKGIMLTSPVPFGLYHFSGRITLGVSIGILLFLFLVIMSRELEIILAGIGGCIAIILMFFSWDKGESIKRIGDFSFSLPINMVPEQFLIYARNQMEELGILINDREGVFLQIFGMEYEIVVNSPKTFRVVFNWTEEQSGRALILGASYLERIRAAVPFIVYSLQQEENVDFVDLTSSEIHAARLEIHWLWLFSAVSMMLCVVLFLMIRSVFHHLL